MSVGDFLESCLGVALMVAVLQGCGTVSDFIAQCDDGKWRGWDHQLACSKRLEAKARP